jgi:glycosyltransferase involved in cell wall biosynthesis
VTKISDQIIGTVTSDKDERQQQRPFFSIITCTFNSDTYLKETIESIQFQEFVDFEHIFIDAFSTDGTVEIIKAYIEKFPTKVSLYQVPAKGISNAMNYGVSLAKGKVILHLHGDDRLADNSVLGKVECYFNKTQKSLVIGNCILTQGSSTFYTWPHNFFKRSLIKLLFLPLMFYSNLVPHPSTFIMKSVFKKHGGFDEQLRVVMDYDFWFRILKSESFCIVDDVFSVYRFHNETVSTKQKHLGLKEIEQVVNKHKGDFKFSYAFFVLILKPTLFLRRVLKEAGVNF